VFLGEDLLAWLVLAFGGAMFVGNVLAMVRPPKSGGDAPRAPRVRSSAMAAVGLAAAAWALVTLVAA
jgi:hypothetical protein